MGAARSQQPPSELDVPKENGEEDPVSNDPKEEADSGAKEAENRGEDCETMEAEAARSGGGLDPDSPAETLKEEPPPAESAEQTEEQEADLGEDDTV